MAKEPKEAVRERVKRYRVKKNGSALKFAPPSVDEVVDSVVDSVVGGIGVPPRLEAAFVVHPVLLSMFARLDRRIAALEGKKDVAPVAGEDLFRRAMEEKRKRLEKLKK